MTALPFEGLTLTKLIYYLFNQANNECKENHVTPHIVTVSFRVEIQITNKFLIHSDSHKKHQKFQCFRPVVFVRSRDKSDIQLILCGTFWSWRSLRSVVRNVRGAKINPSSSSSSVSVWSRRNRIRKTSAFNPTASGP